MRIISQYTTFEVYTFTDSKYVIREKFKKSGHDSKKERGLS